MPKTAGSSTIAKRQVNVRMREQHRDFLRFWFGSPTEGIEHLVELGQLAWDRCRYIFDEFTRVFTATTDIRPAKPLLVPGITFRPGRFEDRVHEPIIVPELFEEGAVLLSNLACRFDTGLIIGARSNVYASWGKQLGKSLEYNDRAAIALGEFCQTWITQYSSCRNTSVAEIVSECQEMFSRALSLAGASQLEHRSLFDWNDKPRYRKAWLAILEGLKERT